MQLMLGTTPLCDVDEAVAQHMLFLFKGATAKLDSPPNVSLAKGKTFVSDDGWTGVLDKSFTVSFKLRATYNVETYTAV